MRTLRYACLCFVLTLMGCASEREESYTAQKNSLSYKGVFKAKFQQDIQVSYGCHIIAEEGVHLLKGERYMRCSDSDSYLMPFDGTIIFQDIQKIISDEKQLELRLREYDLSKLDTSFAYKIIDIHQQERGTAKFKRIIPDDSDQYRIIFDVSLTNANNILENQIAMLQDTRVSYIIPKKYVKIQDDLLYVKQIDHKLKLVSGQLMNDYYVIYEGLVEDEKLLVVDDD